MDEVRTHGVHVTVSDRLRRHFDHKLAAATRCAPRLHTVDATVAELGPQRFAVTLVTHGPDASHAVHGAGTSVYAAADDAVARLRHVLERAHSKRADHHHCHAGV